MHLLNMENIQCITSKKVRCINNIITWHAGQCLLFFVFFFLYCFLLVTWLEPPQPQRSNTEHLPLCHALLSQYYILWTFFYLLRSFQRCYAWFPMPRISFKGICIHSHPPFFFKSIHSHPWVSLLQKDKEWPSALTWFLQ